MALSKLRHPTFAVLHCMSAIVFGVVALLHWVAVGHHLKEMKK